MACRSYCNRCLSIDYNPGVLHQSSMAGFVARTRQDHWWEPEQISSHCWWCDHQNDHQTITDYDYNFYQTMMSLGWFTYSSSIGIMVQTWVQWIQLSKTIADPLQVEVMGYLHQKFDGTESQRTPFSKLRSSYEILRFFRAPFRRSDRWRFLGWSAFFQWTICLWEVSVFQIPEISQTNQLR